MNNVGKKSVCSNKNTARVHFYGVLLFASALTACGGGGGGGDSSSGGSVPIAVAGTLSVDEDTPGTSTLNATDADGDALTYSIVSNPGAGTVSITDTATGAYTYTPDANANGTDSFTFLANDGLSDSNTATVAVTINPINDPAVAAPGVLTIDEDMPGTDTLSASDADGDTLTYSIVGNPGAGTVSITDTATGAYTYTPNANANGTDSFTFLANDGLTDSSTATVAVTINPMNDPPVAAPGVLTIDEDMPGTDTLSASDADGDSLTYSIVSGAAEGVANITDPATGAYTYMPDANADGTDSFTFIANDGLTDSNVATVAVTINPINDPPVATGSCSNTAQAQILTGFLNATDLESPNLLMYSLNADGSGGLGPITTANNGTVTITDATTGEFSYQPASSGARGLDTFTYQATDPDGGNDSATQTVVVDEKIMPLGDSITDGVIGGGPVLPISERLGYRKPLYDSLTGSGFTFDFVGSLTSGSSALPDFDIDHEGHGGWSAFDIAFGMTGFPTDGVRAWLDQNPADIVLLHAGTNDLAQTTSADIADILDEIDQWEQSAGGNPVTVILALIIDQDPINPAVETLNDDIQSMASSRIFGGDDIIIVDQHGALIYPDDLSDQLHPNETGYANMADVWFNALTPIVATCDP